MRESAAFLLVGAWLLVACGGASSADSSGKVMDNADGGVADSAAGAPGELGDAGASGAAGSGAATAGGGASGAGNPAGSAGSQAGNSDLGGSAGFVDRLRYDNPTLCLPIALPMNAALDQTTCVIVEAVTGPCDCSAAGRTPTSPTLMTAIQNKLRIAGSCGATGLPACADFCTCNIAQEEGANGAACKADAAAAAMNATVSPGFCYVDDPTSPQLASCPSNERQKVLFVSKAGHATPTPGATAFVACPP